MRRSLTIANIVQRAGGRRKIVDASDGSVKYDAVRKWEKNGIPERHWPLILRLAGKLSINHLHDANQAVRAHMLQAAE